MSIAGVPISLWQQLSSFADVSFVGAGGQAPIITAKPELPTTNINPFSGARSDTDSFSLINPLMPDQPLTNQRVPLGQADFQGGQDPALALNGQKGQPAPQRSGFVPPGLAKKDTGGLPPGLAKKDTGGLPPGIAKKMNQEAKKPQEPAA